MYLKKSKKYQFTRIFLSVNNQKKMNQEFRQQLENEKRRLDQMSRDELLEKNAEYCYNKEEDILSFDEWRDIENMSTEEKEKLTADQWRELETISTEKLRSIVGILDEDLFTLFRASNGRRYCHLLQELFQYIKVSAIAVEPRTRRPYTRDERLMITTAMKVFFPDKIEEIREAERFIDRVLPPTRGSWWHLSFESTSHPPTHVQRSYSPLPFLPPSTTSDPPSTTSNPPS
jgi:hypothetical protein